MGKMHFGLQVKTLWPVSVVTPIDGWPTSCFFLCRTHAALKDRLPALLSMWTHQKRPDKMTDSSFTPLPHHSFPSDLRNQPYRRADAVRRSVRRRFDDQNLRPVNNGEVVMWRGGEGGGERRRRQCMCWREGRRRWKCNVKRGRGRRFDAEWRTISERWRVL